MRFSGSDHPVRGVAVKSRFFEGDASIVVRYVPQIVSFIVFSKLVSKRAGSSVQDEIDVEAPTGRALNMRPLLEGKVMV